MSQLETLAYIPTETDFIWNYPFNDFCINEYEKLMNENESFPRTQLYIEMLFLVTKKKITGLEEKTKTDPNHFYSRLFFMINSDRILLGRWEPWKDHLDTINWPENFLNERVKTSADNLVKFNL